MIQNRKPRFRTPVRNTGHSHQFEVELKAPAISVPITFSCGHTFRVAGETPEALETTLTNQPDGLCKDCERKKYGKCVTGWVVFPEGAYLCPEPVYFPYQAECPCCKAEAEDAAARRR